VNTSNQQTVIAARQIGAADAPGKKDVATKQHSMFSGVEAEAPGTVTGNEQYTKRQTAKNCLRGFLDEEIGLDRLCFEGKSEIFVKTWVSDHRDTVLVKSDLAFGRALDSGCAIEMIDVSMRDEQQIDSDPQLANPFRDTSWRVDQDISASRLNEVSIRIENTANKSLKVKHCE
jgi:hypothetical protein